MYPPTKDGLDSMGGPVGGGYGMVNFGGGGGGGVSGMRVGMGSGFGDRPMVVNSLLVRLQQGLTSIYSTLSNYATAFEALGGMRGTFDSKGCSFPFSPPRKREAGVASHALRDDISLLDWTIDLDGY